MLEVLPRIVPAPPDRPQVGDADHPMRKVTRQVAFEPTGWTAERRDRVRQLFDGLAAEWHTRLHEARDLTVKDALERGNVRGRMCLEIGPGIGFTTPLLQARFERVFTFDLSMEMLRRGEGRRVQADASALPVRAGAADALLLENMLLFPAEVERVLAPAGALIWVNSLGDATPIHLPAADVVRALPGAWTAVASEAGWGTWCVARRARS